MNFIGDYFAIGLIIVLSLFFFDKRYYLTTASKFFMAALGFTAATALVDLLTGQLLHMSGVPLWMNMTVNSLYFVVNIMATSSIALYLFTKILEHSYDDHCMTYAKRGLTILFVVYLGFIGAGWTERRSLRYQHNDLPDYPDESGKRTSHYQYQRTARK